MPRVAMSTWSSGYLCPGSSSPSLAGFLCSGLLRRPPRCESFILLSEALCPSLFLVDQCFRRSSHSSFFRHFVVPCRELIRKSSASEATPRLTRLPVCFFILWSHRHMSRQHDREATASANSGVSSVHMRHARMAIAQLEAKNLQRLRRSRRHAMRWNCDGYGSQAGAHLEFAESRYRNTCSNSCKKKCLEPACQESQPIIPLT